MVERRVVGKRAFQLMRDLHEYVEEAWSSCEGDGGCPACCPIRDAAVGETLARLEELARTLNASASSED